MKKSASIVVVLFAATGMMLAQAAGSAQGSTSSNTSAGTGMPQAPMQTDAPPAGVTGAPANASANSQSAIALGTPINAQLSKGLDSKKAKQNDPVQARVVQDVLVGGKVVVPRNSKLMGHVTEVTASAKGQPSSLGIAFDKAVLKNGEEVPVHAVIQALAPAPRMPAATGGYPDMDSGTGGGMGAQQPTGGYGTGGGGMNTGPVGGTAQPVGGVAGSSAGSPGTIGNNTVNNAGGAAGEATNTAGMTAGGQLTAASRGVMGMPGVTINAGAANSTNGTVLTNQNHNLKLDGGTQLVLRVTAQ